MARVPAWNVQYEGGILITPGSSSLSIGQNTDWAFPVVETWSDDPFALLAREYYNSAAVAQADAARLLDVSVGSVPILADAQKDPLISLAGNVEFEGLHDGEVHRENWINTIAIGGGPVVSQAGAVVPQDRYQAKMGAAWWFRPWGDGGQQRALAHGDMNAPAIVEAREAASMFVDVGMGGSVDADTLYCQCETRGACCGK